MCGLCMTIKTNKNKIMTEEKVGSVIELIEKRGIMGAVLEILHDSTVPRTGENYQEIKNNLLSFPSGEIATDVFQQQLAVLLDKDEVVLVVFSKKKHNGKIGRKREFQNGFYYYVGHDKLKLSKFYAHWGEEKKFLIQNVACLNESILQVDHYGINIVSNVFCLNISLYDSDKETINAEISIYIGYPL